MEFIMNNWLVIVIILALIFRAVVAFKQPSDVQLARVKEWLLYAVALAEKELGSGTGQLKLRYVYDMFILRFGSMAKMISFETFSTLVDEALYIFRDMLRDNKAVVNYVGVTEEVKKLDLGIDVDKEDIEEGEEING